jgi:cell division protease FtsH
VLVIVTSTINIPIYRLGDIMPVETDNNNQTKQPKIRQFGGSLLILLTFLLLLNLIVPSLLGQGLQQVPYSDFIAQVQADLGA